MSEKSFVIDGFNIKVYSLNTVIVGSGAAGFNAANCLYKEGQKDIAIVTENIMCGTSRNTGSDKQTYYKLTLSSGASDSVDEMAKTLFDGGCVDGDIALCEAALSTRCFYNLVDLGVPFPSNRYGEFVGYKTDHDPRARATSVGPYTSKYMTEQLEKAVIEKNIKIFNKMQVVKILVKNEKAYGIVCINTDSKTKCEERFVCFNCENIIYATGGPSGIYLESAYPNCHKGASGLAFEAGVLGKNLTEWQYGLASLKPRWNVSGTYMQVMPRFISTDENGNDEREFLYDFFKNKYDMLNMIFLKGYQWPFDAKKVKNGSSIIDILVFLECKKGRKVFLDYTANTKSEGIDFNKLSKEVKEYLHNAQVCFGTPYERLEHMNSPAIDLYNDKGVDLSKNKLEIALCAQHNNGGLSIDKWWQTNVKNLYAVGEVAGSHGVYRPGGSALNAGQVGSMRAAQYIANNKQTTKISFQEFENNAKNQIVELIKFYVQIKDAQSGNIKEYIDVYQNKMSKIAAAIRNKNEIESAIKEVENMLLNLNTIIKATNEQEIFMAYSFRDILISQYVYMCSMIDYIKHGAKSRGSALYIDELSDKTEEVLANLNEVEFDDDKNSDVIQETVFDKNNLNCEFKWRSIRPIPNEDNFFENVWREYRNNKNIF